MSRGWLDGPHGFTVSVAELVAEGGETTDDGIAFLKGSGYGNVGRGIAYSFLRIDHGASRMPRDWATGVLGIVE